MARANQRMIHFSKMLVSALCTTATTILAEDVLGAATALLTESVLLFFPEAHLASETCHLHSKCRILWIPEETCGMR
jgi:hypothetical protein